MEKKTIVWDFQIIMEWQYVYIVKTVKEISKPMHPMRVLGYFYNNINNKEM